MQPWQVTIMVSVLVFLAGHLGMAIWFASRVNTKVEAITGDIDQLTKDVRTLVANETRMATLELRVTNAEKAIEGLRK